MIQRQLGHANLGITSVYLQRIDNAEIIGTVYARRADAAGERRSRVARLTLASHGKEQRRRNRLWA